MLSRFLSNPIQAAQRTKDDLAVAGRAAAVQGATETTPPLAHFTDNLGPLKRPADAALSAIQGQVKGDPARFATLATMIAPDTIKALLSTPAGIPLLTAAYGTLAGGKDMASTDALYKPVIDRISGK